VKDLSHKTVLEYSAIIHSSPSLEGKPCNWPLNSSLGRLDDQNNHNSLRLAGLGYKTPMKEFTLELILPPTSPTIEHFD
jgi:hypothetical protein